jgi:hypothetical protein
MMGAPLASMRAINFFTKINWYKELKSHQTNISITSVYMFNISFLCQNNIICMVMLQLPGVDPNDPSVKSLLDSLQPEVCCHFTNSFFLRV